jgi:hypothetical protein
LRQSVYSRLAGYEDLNDAERLAGDPVFRLIGPPKMWHRGAALTSTLHWFETELLTREENLVGLMAVNREVLAEAELYDDAGDFVAAKLRPGNVASADDWDELLLPEIESQQEGRQVAFRADAAFARPEIYEALEAHNVEYAIRIPANRNLERAIEDILFRPRWASQSEAPGSLQELPLRGGQLDEAAPRRRQGRAPCWQAVPARRVHRDELDAPESIRRPVLQQARDRPAMDQGRQAGDPLDAPVVSPVPGQRGAPAAERARLQLGESLAAIGVADASRDVVAHQPAATPRQDRRAPGEACAVLLAPVGGGAPDATPVRRDARPHLGAAGTDGVITAPCTQSAATKKRRKTGALSKKSRDLVSVRRGSSRYRLLPGVHDQEDENGCSTGWGRV